MIKKKRQRAARKSESACYAQAINQLHKDAEGLEAVGAKLLAESRLHDAHTRLDTARCLRVAANFLDGVSCA